MEWFNKAADIKLDHVPYRGAGQAINDLVAGHVKVAFLGPTATLPHAACAARSRLLAQSGEARSPARCRICPTLQEAGYQGIVLESWFAAFAPLGTPPAVIARLNAEFDKALADKAVRDTLFKAGTEPVGGAADKLAKLARADSEKYARIVKEVNIKLRTERRRSGIMRSTGAAALALGMLAGAAQAQSLKAADRRHVGFRRCRDHRRGRQEVVSVRRDAEGPADLHAGGPLRADPCGERRAEDRLRQPAHRHGGGIRRDQPAQPLGVRQLHGRRREEDRDVQDHLEHLPELGRRGADAHHRQAHRGRVRQHQPERRGRARQRLELYKRVK